MGPVSAPMTTTTSPHPRAGAPASPERPELSVIIPAWNEEERIEGAVASAWDAGAGEVIVADGHSSDGTAARAARMARVVASPRGRAAQMNAGARAAAGETLLFLHADARLPAPAARCIRAILAEPSVGGGAFRMRIDAPGVWWRAASALARARTHWWGTVLGDQAIFCRAALFRDLGGYRPLPILEDLDLVERLRRRAYFRLAREEVRSSPRRWLRRGRIRTSALNWAILALYRAGVRPESLAGLYR